MCDRSQRGPGVIKVRGGAFVAPGLVGYNSVFVQLYQAYEQVGKQRGAQEVTKGGEVRAIAVLGI